MANVGEWLIVLVVALIVIGPERLPHVARTLGRWLNHVRRFTHNMKVVLNDDAANSGGQHDNR